MQCLPGIGASGYMWYHTSYIHLLLLLRGNRDFMMRELDVDWGQFTRSLTSLPFCMSCTGSQFVSRCELLWPLKPSVNRDQRTSKETASTTSLEQSSGGTGLCVCVCVTFSGPITSWSLVKWGAVGEALLHCGTSVMEHTPLGGLPGFNIVHF